VIDGELKRLAAVRDSDRIEKTTGVEEWPASAARLAS